MCPTVLWEQLSKRRGIPSLISIRRVFRRSSHSPERKTQNHLNCRRSVQWPTIHFRCMKVVSLATPIIALILIVLAVACSPSHRHRRLTRRRYFLLTISFTYSFYDLPCYPPTHPVYTTHVNTNRFALSVAYLISPEKSVYIGSNLY